MKEENKLNKYIEDNINLLCSDWQPQDNLKMRRVLNKSKKDFLIHQIIEPLLDQQKQEIKKVIEGKRLDYLEDDHDYNQALSDILRAIDELCSVFNLKSK